ncbi:MAG TPA: pilus assembly protein TadG-related protein [Gaiellaceae bacterium]|nr:pilus assembly protein TadG-related protein [Gaiellaceae bacterium]
MEESSRVSVDTKRESGQVLVFVTILLAAIIGLSAIVVDFGYAYYAQRSLQASADASALAGAQQLPDPAAAVATAKQFGTQAGAKNASSKLSSVDEVVTTRCLASVPGCNPVNAVSVQETGHVNTFFVRFFGINTLDVHVRSTACSPCGVKPLDIMLVLDRTGSMCQNSAGQNDPSCYDLNNAKTGIKTFLNFFDPSIDWIGLAVLPPGDTMANKCGTPVSGNYNSPSSPYVLVPLSHDFKNKDGTLNTGSNLVSTVNCVKGGGTTAYANAIDAAEAELQKDGRPTVPDVIVLLSDGAANTGPSYYSTHSPYRTQPCHQGVTSANTAKAAGATVYTIGYALGDDTGGCNSYTGADESPAITVYQAMQGMASTASDFYNQPTPGQLNTIYTQVASDLGHGASSLINDNAP